MANCLPMQPTYQAGKVGEAEASGRRVSCGPQLAQQRLAEANFDRMRRARTHGKMGRMSTMTGRQILLRVETIFVVLSLILASPPGHSRSGTSPAQVSGVAIPNGQIDTAIHRLDALAGDLMQRSGIPGMAIAVVRDGKTVYAKGFGTRRVGEQASVGPDTVFQIASLSKSLASSVVAHEVGVGRVSWNTRIAEALPWFRLSDPWVTEHVTIADLFSHRSGLPDHAGDDLEDLGFGRRVILDRLRFLPLHGFRDTYAYTNFGLTAAAEAVAVTSGQDWAQLSRDVLYGPLGMNRTSSQFADFEAQANRASGHVRTPEGYQPKYQRRPDEQSPAGGVSSTANDLARWMIMMLDEGRFEGRQIIPAGALLPAITAQVIASPATSMDARPGFYGYGVGVGISPAGRVVLSHSGAFALGAGTYYALLPSERIGIVVLTNAAPSGVAESLGAGFLDLVQFGAVTRDWFAAYAPLMAGLLAPTGDLVSKAAPVDPAPAAPLSAYEGIYTNSYFGEATVTAERGGLQLQIGTAGRRYALRHWSGDVFAVSPSSENETDGSLSSVVFRRDRPGPSGDLTITYLSDSGVGSFVRR
jgi:CubicO group peptidase (beta-lactamase class C family)